MKLATVSSLVEELGFDDMSDINAAAAGALQAATSVIEARIGVTFEERATVDRFYVQEPGHIIANSFVTEFRLSNGFVRELTHLNRVPDVSLFGTSHMISYIGDVILDKDKGKITDYKTYYSRHFVEVGYTSGFPVSFEDDEAYDPEFVPSWLQQAAKMKAMALLSKHPVMAQSQLDIDARSLNNQVESIIARNVRYMPNALLPL